MYYFAYATNLSQKQMRERCPDSQPIFRATLPNYKLVFLGWSREWWGGKASIRHFRGEKVLGAIYDVTEQCLQKLDKYEDHFIHKLARLLRLEHKEMIEAKLRVLDEMRS